MLPDRREDREPKARRSSKHQVKRFIMFNILFLCMRYEFDDGGKTTIVDTKQIDYEAVWGALGLKKKQREEANRIIDLYNSANFNDGITIVTAYSCMKPYNRETQRHQADHYRTRLELERVAQDNRLVRKLVHHGVLELHQKWRHLITRKEEEDRIVIGPGHKRHPQAQYRLNIWNLYELESSPELEYEAL